MKLAPLFLAPVFCLAALLAGCGSGPGAQDSARTKGAIASFFTAGLHAGPAATDPAADLALRAALEADRQPIYRVSIANRSYASLMAPYGQNQNVTTWASTAYETVSLNNGILLATRGFGSDLMSAIAPTLAQVSKPGAQFQRVYYYLDGADQSQHLSYNCTTATGPTETVTILAKTYPARQIIETCVGPAEEIINRYWFENSGKLRQSDQFWAPGASVMHLQHVID